MKMHKLILLVALSVMALFSVACDDVATPIDDNTIQLTQTETIQIDDFGLSVSVSYPSGWFISNESGAILLANSEEALAISDFSSSEFPVGSAVMTITVIPPEMGGVMGIEEGASSVDILDVFVQFMSGDGMPTFSDIEEVTINDATIAHTTGSDEDVSATIYALATESSYLMGFGATRADEAGSQSDTFEAIIASTVVNTGE
jgi:hypothetical protein